MIITVLYNKQGPSDNCQKLYVLFDLNECLFLYFVILVREDIIYKFSQSFVLIIVIMVLKYCLIGYFSIDSIKQTQIINIKF